MIIACPFIQHTKLVMVYINDARVASLNITHYHKPQAQETSGIKLGTLTNPRHVRATLRNTKIKIPKLRDSRQHMTYMWYRDHPDP